MDSILSIEDWLRYLSQSSIKNSQSKVVEVNGFEPMASCVQGRRSPS